MEFSSKIIEQAVNAFGQLPGVGKKTALRYVLHLIKNSNEDANQLAQLIKSLKIIVIKRRERTFLNFPSTTDPLGRISSGGLLFLIESVLKGEK